MCDTSPQIATELLPNQEIAIGELLAGRTIVQAAKKAKVDRSTVHRWLSSPDFREEYDRRRQELRDAVRARLLALANEAVTCLKDAIKNGDAKSAVVVLKGLDLLEKDRPDCDGGDAITPVRPEPETIREPMTSEEMRQDLSRLHQEVMQKRRQSSN